MKKSFWSLLPTLCLALALLPASALAAEETGVGYADLSDELIQFEGFPKEAERGATLLASDVTKTQAKAAILAALKAQAASIDVSSYGLAVDEGKVCYQEVLNENPELFYVSGGFSWSYSGSTVINITPKYEGYTDEQIRTFNAVCDSILAQLDASMTNEQIYLYLHDYLVTHCCYDQTYSCYNAYDALVDGTAVCQGYSEAYACLAKLAGLSAPVVSSKAQNHAWNLVTLDGERYYVDCTWDDPLNDAEYYCGHTNFLRSRDAMHTAKDSGGTGHSAGTDWVDPLGNNVYDTVPGGTKYDDYFWTDVTVAIPMVGGIYGYAKSTDRSHVYLCSAENGEENPIDIGLTATWNVWNNPYSYWTDSYITVAGVGDRFYFNTPTEIYSLSTSGSIELIYSWSEDDQAIGYIYGLFSEGNHLYYYLGTAPNYGNAFIRKSLEIDEAAYQISSVALAANGTDVTVTAANYGDRAAQLLIVVYDGNGRMLQCEMRQLDTGASSRVVVPMDVSANASAYEARAFLADPGTWAPLCKSVGSLLP